MKKLRYGMVGGGPGSFIGDAHRKAINIDALAELTAGCFSRTLENSLQTGKELGVAADRCYASFEAMAKAEAAREDGIDFVVVVTPNVSHYPVCKAFLEAGIHVSCDKPLCLEVEQAEELCRLAKEKGLLFLVTYTYMGHVTAKQIPDEVWERVEEGESLAAAFSLYTIQKMREQEAIEKVNAENESKSAPRIRHDGEDTAYFSPEAVKAMSRSEIKKNYDAILASMDKWS